MRISWGLPAEVKLCRCWKRSLPPSRRNCIVFSGVMNYHPNAEAALFLLDSILPLVRKVCPQLEILIVGRDPLSELVKVAKRYSGVTVTGAVDDVRPYLERRLKTTDSSKELLRADCLRLRRRRPRAPGLCPSARIRS